MTRRATQRPAPPRRRATKPAAAAAAPAGRSYGGRTPDDRVAERRRRFLDAGRRVFGDVGYRNATVRSLCHAAGLTERYFYESFAGTGDLLMAVYRECVAELENALARTAADQAGVPAGDAVPAILDAFFRHVERDPALARVVWREVLGVSPVVDALYTDQVRRFARLLLDLAAAVSPAMRIGDNERDAIAIALVGAVSQSALDWLLTDYRAPRGTVVSATTRVFLALIDSLSPPTTKIRRKSA